MNNLGFSNDNLFIGDVRVKGQDETIIIGNENGGDGYILPTEKGTVGQVITMNADNTTSFQDGGGGTTGRIIKNLFTMIDINTSYGATPVDVYSSGYGSLNLGSIDNFPVGATIHLYTKGTWNVGGTSSDTGTFRFIINSGQSTELQYTAPVSNSNLSLINFYYTDIICQRTGTNEYKFKGAGIISTSSGNVIKINWVSNTITPATPFSNFDIRFAFTTSNNLYYPLTSVFKVNMILDSSLLIDPPPAPTSHLALSDLNATGVSGFADAGHDLMFLSNASKPINGNYFLPTTDGGVAGGVLTTNGAGITSFQTLTSGVTRAWVNKYSILTNPTFGNPLPIATNLDLTGSGSKNYTDVNFPIGSQLHIQACGTWNVNCTNTCLGQFVLGFSVGGGFAISDVFELIPPVTTLNEVNTGLGYWSVDVNIIRTGPTTIRLGKVSVNSRLGGTSIVNVPVVNSIANDINGGSRGIPAFPFDIDLQWIDQSNPSQCFPVAGTYNHNVINANDTLAITTNPSLDHNTLSNLTTGDPHSQYTKLSGRVGGQVLSGGLLPIHNLVLKSHDIGLPNVTVRDLDTEFNKNIDMGNNSLLNAFGLNTQFLLATSQIETSQIISVGLGQQNYVANPHIFTADGTPATQQLEINNVEISAFKPINMNDNEILQCNNIRTNTQPILTINKNGSNATEIYGNSTIRRLQISNGVYLLTGTDLFCGNNNIQQCGNLEVSTINNITPVGGLYASTSAGTIINNTTIQSLTPSSSVGSLSVPPNGFSVADCYHLVITGDCVFNNNDDVQITLKQNGNILAQTPVFSLEDANSGNNVFEIEADFNIRSIGATGSIHTSFEFTYNKDSLDSRDFRGTRSNDTQTINTTIASSLDIEFQFITKDPSSSIQTQLFRLQKVF